MTLATRKGIGVQLSLPFDMDSLKRPPFSLSPSDMRGRALVFSETESLLGRYGINLTGRVARNPEEATRIAREMATEMMGAGKAEDFGDCLFAVKVNSKVGMHKTGSARRAMYLNRSTESVGQYADTLLERFGNEIDGVLMQPMVSGTEFYFGAMRDPAFGIVVNFGMGGIDIEVKGDIVHAVSDGITPLTMENARSRITDIKNQAFLKEFRGLPAVDIDRFAKVMVDLYRLMEENLDIAEIDLNPATWNKRGELQFVDARVLSGEVQPKVAYEPMPQWKKDSIDAIFEPKECAIIGASRKIGGVGDSTVQSMLDRFDGTIYLVNPNFENGVEAPMNPSLIQILKILEKNRTPYLKFLSDRLEITKEITTTDILRKLGVSADEIPYELHLSTLLEERGKRNRVVLLNDVSKLPTGVDLGIFVNPSKRVPGAFKQFAERGGKGAIILTDNFGETGNPENAALEETLIGYSKHYKVGYIGVNCLGAIDDTINTMFLPKDRTLLLKGESGFGVLTQSGGLGVEVYEYTGSDGVPVRTWITCGNSGSLNAADLLDYRLGSNDKVKFIAVHVESVGNGAEFFHVIDDIVKRRGKPIVIMKGGDTEETAKLAGTHTKGVTTQVGILKSAFAQAGCIEVESMKEMAQIASLLATQKRAETGEVGIVGVGGGIGIIISDRCAKFGLKRADLSGETVAKLKSIEGWEDRNIGNPFDTWGSADNSKIISSIKAMNEDKHVGVVVTLIYPQVPGITEELWAQIAELNKEMKKPLVVSLRGHSDYIDGIRHKLWDMGVPTYTVPIIAPLAKAVKIWLGFPDSEFHILSTDYVKAGVLRKT